MMHGIRAYLATVALCLLFILCAFQIYDHGNLYESLPVPRLSITPRTFDKNQHRESGIPTNKTPVNKILLMTYMRSGSSFVGELLRFGGDVFYVFEPFWLVYEKTFRTDTEICHRNGTCLRPIKTLQKTNKTLDIINAIFDCRISELPKEVLKSFTKFHFTSGYSKRCKSILTKRQSLKSRRGGIKQYDNKKEWCLARWEKACQEASARVIKTIRLSPRALETMHLPDVKVVHLTRHPLGILNSRMNIGEVNTTNMLAHARHLCQMMEQDIHYVNNKKTENWIGEHTHDVIKIPNAHNESLRQETGTNNYTHGTFHIRKTSSKDVASAWRRSLSKELIQRIKGVCQGVIDAIASEESSKSVCL
uniref:Carbohydrate sulfotransferase 5-like isoform X2 n=1 Tax=Crassostrea virginica TaxID=6565 RepID=A0A8B8EUM1_CRAVI|nr:carbohydrate sulfotransferase 5-like isoform X2 [Crassostrea virginica]